MLKSEIGLTLYELMVAVAISSFLLLAIHATYKSQQKSYVVQKQVSAMQQNLRGAICFLQREIRLAGYDPQDSGDFGITDISVGDDGNGTITFSLDDDLNNTEDESDGNGRVDDRETLSFLLYDYPTTAPDGILDLGRKQGGTRRLVSENIEAMGFAFAFDSTRDGDDSLDRDMNGNIIWAIDSDHDGDLDVNLDTDNDGDIDVDDDQAGESLAQPDNGGLALVHLSDIRAVKIWLLARGDKDDAQSLNAMTYVVSNQRIAPKDGLHRRLMTTSIRCRNLGVRPNH